MRTPLVLALMAAVLACTHAAPPVSAAPAPAEPTWPEPAPPELRLSDAVAPTRYQLALTLIPSEPTYSGTVTAELEVREPVRQVWLHAEGLEVSAARMVAGGQTLEARVVQPDAGRLGVLLPSELAPGKAQLTLTFTGRVNREKSEGIYGQDERGEPYLYTFFEPIDARKAFPCFDEPRFKVPWQLAFTVKQEHVARANSPIASEEPLADGLKRVTFAESKPMPSYLVAFMVGPFDVIDAGRAGRAQIPVQFIVPRGRGAETAYAVSVTPKLVAVLEDFFDQPYPFEKLDVAVVPRYWGTMEHPGIVALGQPLTLIRPGEETVARRQHYTHIALHELGHYWFGDVVTCAWWDDVWLNESLTSWLDQHSVDAFAPAWGYGLEAGTDAREYALASDALTSALPVRKAVKSNDDIIGSFDNATTYFKGASVLRMFEGWLGTERMRQVMHRWVREHAWKVASAEDFVATLEAELGPEAAKSFQSFIQQPGAPRISAELTCAAGAAPKLTLSQERFVPAGSAGASAAQSWSVPVCVRAGSGRNSERNCTVLTAKTGELELAGKQCPSWVLLNAGGTGYYTSGYSRAQWKQVLAVPTGAASTAERLALLSDLSAAVKRGDLPRGEALAVVPTTAKDPSRLVLEHGADLVRQVRIDRLSEQERAQYKAWLRKLYGPRARAEGWAPKRGEADEARKLRNTLLSFAGGAGEDPALSSEGARLGRAWLEDHAAVNADVAPLALRLAARQGDRAFFDAIVEKAKATQDREERAKLLAALGSFRDRELESAALALVGGSEFDLRESRGILETALRDPETRGPAWEFYKAHFDALVAKMRSDEAGWFIGLAGVHCDDAKRAEVQSFLGPRVQKVENGARSLGQAVEQIQLCAQEQTRNAKSVSEFLQASTSGK